MQVILKLESTSDTELGAPEKVDGRYVLKASSSDRKVTFANRTSSNHMRLTGTVLDQEGVMRRIGKMNTSNRRVVIQKQ